MAKNRIRSVFGFGLKGWLTVWFFSLVLGSLIYLVTVWASYLWLAKEIQRAPLQSLNSLATRSAAEKGTGALIAQKLGVQDKKAIDWLSAALLKLGEKGKTLKDIPVAAIISQAVLSNRGCTTCPELCAARFESSLVRLLGGWPGDVSRAIGIVSFAPEFWKSTTGNEEEACRLIAVEKETWPTAAGLFLRSPPLQAPDIASLLLGPMGPEACDNPDSPDAPKCRLLTRLLQNIVDSEHVRAVRSLVVNLFYGWERLAVWILVVACSLVCIVHWLMRMPYDSAADRIASIVEGEEDPSGEIRRPKVILARLKKVLENRGRTSDFNPIRDLIVSAEEETVSPGSLKARAALYLDALETDRMSIDSMVAIFPVIGFVATLLGLIEALAAANKIATTIGDRRGAEILDVTAVLSSCFSTTFLALVAMAVFAVLNMIQARKERGLIRGLEVRLDRVVAEIKEQERSNAAANEAQVKRRQALRLREDAKVILSDAVNRAKGVMEEANRLMEDAAEPIDAVSTNVDIEADAPDAVPQKIADAVLPTKKEEA